MARRWRRDVFAAKAAADAQSPTNIPGCGRRCCDSSSRRRSVTRCVLGATTTTTGLKVECAIDPHTYEKGVKVTDAEFDAIHLVGDPFHPEWNYSILPGPKRIE
jgi:hypothetical protein